MPVFYMIFTRFEKSILITVGFLITFVSIPLICISYLEKSYILGFLLGSILSISFFLINIWFTKILVSKKRQKTAACAFAAIKWIVFLILTIGFTLIVIYSNKAYNGSVDNGIFNLIFFVCSINMIPLSIFSYFLSEFIKNRIKNRKNLRKESND